MPGEFRVAQQHRRDDGGVDPGAEPHRVGDEHQVLQEQVRLDLGAHRPDGPERQFDVLVEEPALHPFLDAGRAVEVAVVDDRGPAPLRLGQEVHQRR